MFMNTNIEIPEKKKIRGEWSLDQLFDFNKNFTKKELLSGKEITPAGSQFTFKYEKTENAILVTKSDKPYFSMNFWINKDKVRRIEAYDKLAKKSAYPIPQKIRSGKLMKMPLVELGVNYKSAIRVLREMCNKGILKIDAMKILGVESTTIKSKTIALNR